MISRGDVIYDPDFVFNDGGHADKLFVVLSEPAIHSHVFVVLTTSQQAGNRKKDRGCQRAKKEFFLAAGKEFPKDTWLTLWRRPILLPVNALSERIRNNICAIKNNLPEQRVNEIRNCLASCTGETLTRDHCSMLGVKYQD